MTKKIFIFIYIFLTFLAIDYIFANQYNTDARAEINFESHTIINKFSILIPAKWNAKTQSSTDDFFILTNYEIDDNDYISTNSIKTEVIFLGEPVDVILDNHIRAIKNSKENIIKRGNIIIDGQSAIRVWYQGNGMDFPNSISSYIPYDNEQTVIIHSYYNPENPLAVDTIERVHWSFKNLK
ncbi:MAG: PsbP-related protein [Xenococcaceae cyanobacterium MO_188.B29]|nr:PsbP-related protein [Xenococcaceae cyanobacterium MO_188.B29]